MEKVTPTVYPGVDPAMHVRVDHDPQVRQPSHLAARRRPRISSQNISTTSPTKVTSETSNGGSFPEAGDYYVASPSSGVNIYYLEVVPGPPPERAAWDDVSEPTITDVRVSGGEILVDYDGLVGFDGADVATATLFDADGDELDSNLSGTPGDAPARRTGPVRRGSTR